MGFRPELSYLMEAILGFHGSDTWVSWMEDLASIEASSAYIQLQCFNKINLVLN